MPYISLNKSPQISLLLIYAAISTPLLAADSDTGGTLLIADSTVCHQSRITLPPILVNAPAGLEAEQATIIEGDAMNIQGDEQIMLHGNAQIVQGKQGVFADYISYDTTKNYATAKGNVRFYTADGDAITTEDMRLETDTFIGDTGPGKMRLAKRGGSVIHQSSRFYEDFSLLAPLRNRSAPKTAIDTRPMVETRIHAERIDLEGKDFQRFTTAQLSRCPEGNDDVMVVGKEIKLDHAAGLGYAKNVRVKFKGVPIFYSPYLSFPLDDRRKSGFLTPSIGVEGDSGTQINVPYYFNLAPNYDATVRGSYMAKRGTQLYGEFRHLTAKGSGNLKGEYLPGDALFNGADRYALGLDYQYKYSNGWESSIDLQDVSDTEYRNDFSNDIEITSKTHLRQRGTASYDNDLLSTDISLTQYKTVNKSFLSSKPYERLPQLQFNVKPWQAGAFRLGLDTEWVQFSHADNARVSGSRLNAEPYVTLPYEPVYGYIKPKISFKHLSYNLDNAADEARPSITVPKTVIDSGVYFERDLVYGEVDYLHTLEPRIMYVNVGTAEQTGFPDFDTGESSVSSYSYLFRDSRFVGGDRIGDDEHIALGITTRLINDATGKEKMSASIGQLYYLADRTVSLSSNDSSLSESRSDIFAQTDVELIENYSADSFLRYDASENEVRNFNLGLDYSSNARREASLDYLSTKDKSEDLRLAFNLPLAPHLQLGYAQRYSLTDSEERSSSIKLVYDSCCWAIGLSVKRLLQSDGSYQNSMFATFELDGLGRVQSAVQ